MSKLKINLKDVEKIAIIPRNRDDVLDLFTNNGECFAQQTYLSDSEDIICRSCANTIPKRKPGTVWKLSYNNEFNVFDNAEEYGTIEDARACQTEDWKIPYLHDREFITIDELVEYMKTEGDDVIYINAILNAPYCIDCFMDNFKCTAYSYADMRLLCESMFYDDCNIVIYMNNNSYYTIFTENDEDTIFIQKYINIK